MEMTTLFFMTDSWEVGTVGCSHFVTRVQFVQESGLQVPYLTN